MLVHEQLKKTNSTFKISFPALFSVENSVVSIQFPSLSALLRSCPVPGGCQWGYVLEFQGLDNKEVDKDRPKKYWLQHGNSDKELATIQVQEGK